MYTQVLSYEALPVEVEAQAFGREQLLAACHPVNVEVVELIDKIEQNDLACRSDYRLLRMPYIGLIGAYSHGSHTVDRPVSIGQTLALLIAGY